jgi:hypothetical protein
MNGKLGTGCGQVVSDVADAQSGALKLMSAALGHLDRDSEIPPIVGAQLQMAIDALWANFATGELSTDLH